MPYHLKFVPESGMDWYSLPRRNFGKGSHSSAVEMPKSDRRMAIESQKVAILECRSLLKV